jgi:hypothetical protein
MVDIEALAHSARRVADRSRARMAIRVAWVIAPLACLSIASGAHTSACLCMGVVLLAVASLLRWRGRAGIEAVTAGLVLGAIPFAAALLLRTCGIECGKLGSITPAELTCFAAGAIAGAGVSLRVARASDDRRGRWLATLLVASLTAAVGCVGLGAAGVLATLAAVLASAMVVWIPIAARAT